MLTTIHLQSAQEINASLFDKIKKMFGNKPIAITVEEDDETTILSKDVSLLKSIQEDKNGLHISVDVPK